MTLSRNAIALLEDGVVPGFMSTDDLPAALDQVSREGRMRLLRNLHERAFDFEQRLAHEPHPHFQNWAGQSLSAIRERIALVEASVG
jgi:hypothetical protein